MRNFMVFSNRCSERPAGCGQCTRAEGGGLRDPNNIKAEKFRACRRRRGCQLEEAETSVRRRFVGSFRTRYELADRRTYIGWPDRMQ